MTLPSLQHNTRIARCLGQPGYCTGARSAPHSHDEFEQVFVISGSFHDGERLLRANDYCCRAAGEVHEASTEKGARVLVVYSPA